MVNKALLVFFLLVCSSAFAQSEGSRAAQSRPSEEQDPRLPPVLPGEEVKRSGKNMKVWSTAGSPSVTIEVPTPNAGSQDWTAPRDLSGGSDRDVSIIVDGREVLPNTNPDR